MGDVIYASFGRQPKITARDFLESAERNERAAIDFPDLSRPFTRLAGQRRRQAAMVQKLMEGAGA